MRRYLDENTFYDHSEGRRVSGLRLTPTSDVSMTFSVIVNAGDTYESLAYANYGNSELWWVIADQNPLAHPLYLTPGSRIRILKPRFLPVDRPPSRYGGVV